jgi:hypothetical protein
MNEKSQVIKERLHSEKEQRKSTRNHCRGVRTVKKHSEREAIEKRRKQFQALCLAHWEWEGQMKTKHKVSQMVLVTDWQF